MNSTNKIEGELYSKRFLIQFAILLKKISTFHPMFIDTIINSQYTRQRPVLNFSNRDFP